MKAEDARARHRVTMTRVGVPAVFLVVAAAGLLTYLDKVDGSAFTFLLGLVVGYVLSFVRDAIAPPEE